MSRTRSKADRKATGADLRRLALVQPEAVETLTWGEPHFRIRNKIFTGLGTRDGRVVSSVKLEKAHADLRSFDPRFRPAPYVGRFGWVEFALDEVTVGELASLVEESYQQVAKPKAPSRKKGSVPSRRKRATSTRQ